MSAVRAVALTVALGGFAAAAGAATAQQAAPPLPPAEGVRAAHCSLKGDKTIAANRYVRVFQKSGRGFGRVYGCRRDARRAFKLGFVGECQNTDEVRKVEVAGRRVVLGIFECSLTDGWWRVDLVNLRNGRREFSSKAFTDMQAPNETVFRVVVTADGGVAWAADRVDDGVRQAVEIRRRLRGTTGKSLLLDSGIDIDPDSLRRRGRTITWTKGAIRRLARI